MQNIKQIKKQAITNDVSHTTIRRDNSLYQFKDNRPEATTQLKVQQMANQPIQKKENKTGMPDNLKSGIENLSGMDMSDVNVHYNSPQPAQLQAHAFAQGNQIHIASGQERHLPHEAWHVVQQKQGRVAPTKQLKGKVNINDDDGLEKEADVMGAKAMKFSFSNYPNNHQQKLKSNKTRNPDNSKAPYQRIMKATGKDMDTLRKEFRNTVYLVATFTFPDGSNFQRVFNTTRDKHAEENLIDFINTNNYRNCHLRIQINASPCSSEYGTRDDGHPGCQERLREMSAARNITLNVEADHPYQPQNASAIERELGFPAGFSSFCATQGAGFLIHFDHAKGFGKDSLVTPGLGIIQAQKNNTTICNTSN